MTTPAQAKLSQEDMAANYGWALSFLKSNKELWKLFQTAVKNNYSTNRFVAALRDTKWFKNNSDTARQNLVLQKTDPATYNQRLAAMQTKVAQEAGTYGSILSQAMIHQISSNAMMFGWDDTMLRKVLAEHVTQMFGGHYGGDAGKAEMELRNYAQDMGVTLSDPSIKTWLSNIVGSTHTIDDYKGYIMDQAQKMFPSLSKLIAGGQTVAQIAEPYKQMMGQTLELDPNQINVFTPEIKRALQGEMQPGNSGTGQANGEPTSIPLWRFEQLLKSDPRWLKTDNARNSIMDAGSQVLKDMGMHF